MIQLYLLSILLNGLVGFTLVFGEQKEDSSIEKSMKFSLSSSGFRLILGVLSAIIGVLKLFSPMEGIYILGDLLPALAGLSAGFILLFNFYREHASRVEDEGRLDRIGDAFLRYKKPAGIAMLVIAALHFIFPSALFL